MTKLFIPPVRSGLVSRPRLIARLDDALQYKITLISAPAGFGKTTLLSEWLALRPNPGTRTALTEGVAGNTAQPEFKSAWLTLDKDDNDPPRFLAYLVAALQGIEAGVGNTALALLKSMRVITYESILTSLINDLVRISTPFVLILDDYHVIETRSIHQNLTYLVDHLPPQMHLVIATRSDPPLPLARLRGRGEVNDLRADELRFTLEEVTQFLQKIDDQELPKEAIATLFSETEGWVAGLQMAVITLQGSRDKISFIRQFAGSSHYIMDYLVEEVLHRQPKEIQVFLLHTSILEQLCAPLCDALIGSELGIKDLSIPGYSAPISGSISQCILDYLEHANLFVVPLDDQREWFRCHHLFAELLHHLLLINEPEAAQGLHHRASVWFESKGYVAEAIRHAIAADDPERTANLIERFAELILSRGESTSLLHWIEALPESALNTHPLLQVYQAGILLISGHPVEEVEEILEKVIIQPHDELVSGVLAVFQCLLATYAGDWRESTEFAKQALALLPEDRRTLRSLVYGIRSLNTLFNEDITSAMAALQEAVWASQQAGNLLNLILAKSHLAELLVIQGRLHQAQVIFRQSLELARDEQGKYMPFAGWALIGQSYLHFERNELLKAEQMLSEGIELVRLWGEIGVLKGYFWLARVRRAQKDFKSAQEILDRWQDLAGRFDAMQYDDVMVGIEQAYLSFDRGDLQAAQGWLKERGLPIDMVPDFTADTATLGFYLIFLRGLEYVLLARILLFQEKPDEALQVIKPAFKLIEKHECWLLGYQLKLLEILALQAKAESQFACEKVADLLVLTMPEGFIRLYLDLGTPVQELLKTVRLKYHLDPAIQTYIEEILAAFDGEIPTILPPEVPAPFTGRPEILIEPLSARELDILRLLVAGFTNQEIANRLFLSLHTVKWHNSNIYRKLGVSSRSQAAAKARQFLEM